MRFFSSGSPDEEEEPEASSSPLPLLLPEPLEELLDQEPSLFSEPLSDFLVGFLFGEGFFAGEDFFSGDFIVFLIGVATTYLGITLVSSGFGA